MTLGLILFLMVCVAFVVFSNELNDWLSNIWAKAHYKLLITISILTFILVLFVQQLITVLFNIAYGYYFLVLELTALFNIGPIGNLFAQTLLLTCVPLGISYLVATIYRLYKRRELQKVEQFVGVLWCLLVCIVAWHLALAAHGGGH